MDDFNLTNSSSSRIFERSFGRQLPWRSLLSKEDEVYCSVLRLHFKMFLRLTERLAALRATYQSSRLNIIELPRLGTFSIEAIFERPDLIPAMLATALDQLQLCLPQSWSCLSRVDLSYILASTAAHNLKPYGKGCPSQELSELLKSECLDCSNYGLLTYYISRLFLSEEDRKPLSFVGWDGGAIGNHQMLFLSEHGKMPHLAIDPTLGIACIATFDEIASGKPTPPDAIAIIGARKQLSASRVAFVTALLRGQFRPSQLLYYFPTAEDYLTRYGNPLNWPTPAISILRDRHFEN